MKHKLKIENMFNFESKTQIAGSFGKGENKSLNIVTKITILGEVTSVITVEKYGIVVFTTTVLKDAINTYNEI